MSPQRKAAVDDEPAKEQHQNTLDSLVTEPSDDHKGLLLDSLALSSFVVIREHLPWLMRDQALRLMRKAAREALARNRVLVAVSPRDPWLIHGFIIARGTKPVWMYVKVPYRGAGVEEKLLEAVRGTP